MHGGRTGSAGQSGISDRWEKIGLSNSLKHKSFVFIRAAISRRAVKAHRLSADVHILAQKVATTLQPDPKKGLV